MRVLPRTRTPHTHTHTEETTQAETKGFADYHKKSLMSAHASLVRR